MPDDPPPTKADYDSVQAAMAAMERQGWSRWSLNDAVAAWASLVEDVEQGYGWFVEEYTNDLRTRLWLDRVAPLLTPFVQAGLAERLAPLDERFRRATVEPAARLPGAGAEWWCRLPRVLAGDLARDAEAMGLVPPAGP